MKINQQIKDNMCLNSEQPCSSADSINVHLRLHYAKKEIFEFYWAILYLSFQNWVILFLKQGFKAFCFDLCLLSSARDFTVFSESFNSVWAISTAQKMKFSIKDFFSKYDQICRKSRSHLLKKSLMENVIFCAVLMLQRWC